MHVIIAGGGIGGLTAVSGNPAASGCAAGILMASAPVIDPMGNFAIQADAAYDCLRILRKDGTRHRIVPQCPGAGPSQVLFHPDLAIVYACNACNSTITAHHWDGTAGHLAFAQSLRLLPPKFRGVNRTIGIALSPSGRYLYAVNQGHNSIAIAAIQRGKGKLFLRAREMLPATPNAGPALNADGTIMQLGPDISYAVQPANGTIARIVPECRAE